MTDPDRNRQRDHWQAIAEQLGLAPEQEALTEEATPPPAPAAGVKPSPPQPAVKAVAERPAAKEPAPARQERVAAAKVEEQPSREPPEPPLAEAREESVSTSQPAEPPEEEAAPKHRRRRRPKSARAAKSNAAEQASAGAGPLEENPGDEAEERATRRGRGRGRRKKGKPERTAATSVAEDEEIVPKAAEPAETEDADLDDLRSLSSWNVPSWNELIASLYRPER
jgi:hypothetical protein